MNYIFLGILVLIIISCLFQKKPYVFKNRYDIQNILLPDTSSSRLYENFEQKNTNKKTNDSIHSFVAAKKKWKDAVETNHQQKRKRLHKLISGINSNLKYV